MSTTTYRLYHHPLDPASRYVRLAMAEKSIACELILEKPWAPSDLLRALNPAASVPVLVIAQGDEDQVLCDAQAICEYLEETHTGTLLGKTVGERVEARRLVGWFEHKFDDEVTQLLVGEKALKRLGGIQGGLPGSRGGEPDSAVIRAGCANIRGHMDYIGWLSERRNWLAGDMLTLADLIASAHLSVIDYLGDAPWDEFPIAKEWYARLKSRPSFRSILGDYIPGFPPPRHYADLDF